MEALLILAASAGGRPLAEAWRDIPKLSRIGLSVLLVAALVGAIANAVYDAVGVRLREIPFTPERVRDAMEGKDS